MAKTTYSVLISVVDENDLDTWMELDGNFDHLTGNSFSRFIRGVLDPIDVVELVDFEEVANA